MAVFKVKDKKKTPKNVKKILGITLLVVSCVVLFFMITNLVPVIHNFLLGAFGLFGYPFFALTFLIAVALINNRNYTYSKMFTTFLCLSIFFLLCIIQMAIIGNKFVGEDTLSFGEHLALSYQKKYTAGGIIIGLFSTSLTYLVGYVWAYVIFAVLFVASAAIFADIIRHMVKMKKSGKPVKVSLKEIKKKGKVEKIKDEEPVKEEKIKASIGLVRKSPESFERKIEVAKEEVKPEPEKRSILTPPEFDFDKFFKKPQAQEANIPVKEVEKNINELKTNSISPEQVVHNESFNLTREHRVRGNLPEIAPEQVVSEVDDIIKEVVKENKVNVEEIEEPEEKVEEKNDRVNFERNVERALDRNLGNSDRNFDRSDRNFDRSDRNFDRSDRALDRSDRNFDRTQRFVNIEDEKEEEIEEIKPYNYQKPPIDLITTQSTDMSDLDEGVANKIEILENTLEQFSVAAKVQNIVIGPAVTRYEMEMPAGVSVKKIVSLSSDIALALEATGGDVRIEAPVPGKNVVGIEAPNEKVATVSLKDLIASPEFQNAKSPLSYAVGKDITGNIIIGDIAKAPHLLVAGTTGSGKSVMLNSIILSLIYKASPEDVRLLLVDPKQVEFKIYEGIPHLLTPRILTDATKAGNALTWAVDEMERRYKLISDANVRDIGEYNRSEAVLNGKKKKMPYIVFIIDEFSDFMMTSKKEVEDKIVRIGQKARAAGIHMILATQRPTTECVTGNIKTNFPSRIAFKVASRVDSDVILGATGAEKLLGKGDMLYAPQELSANPKRVQGCFVTTEEILNIVNYATLNNAQIVEQEIIDAINNTKRDSNTCDNEQAMDPLLPRALKIAIDAGVASCSTIQRKLSVGFSRAGRIVDQMTELGYISAPDGFKPRKVYITLEEYYQIFGDEGV